MGAYFYKVFYWSEKDEGWIEKTKHRNLGWAIIWEDRLKKNGFKTKITYLKHEVTEEEKTKERSRI